MIAAVFLAAAIPAVAIPAASPAAADAADPPIRIWGPAAMRGIATRWAEAYRARHPAARFAIDLRGSDTAIPGLYGGRADIALMGRANDAVDDAGFSRPLGHAVTRLAIANGAVAAPGKAPAIALLVPAANPLAALRLDQLARILDCGAAATGKAGAPAAYATWGDLGLSGAWAARPIHVHGYDFAGRTGLYLQHVVTKDARKMCWERITEYRDRRRLDGTVERAAEQAGAAARRDPGALAIADANEAHDGLRLLALAGADGQPVLPTAATIVAGRYPLARRAFAFVDRRPGTAIAPPVAAFLAWTLSPEGQALLEADDGFLPLDRATAAAATAIVEAAR